MVHAFESSLGVEIQLEVRYFRTSNWNFPGSLVSRPLVKGKEGYEGEQLATF